MQSFACNPFPYEVKVNFNMLLCTHETVDLPIGMWLLGYHTIEWEHELSQKTPIHEAMTVTIPIQL
jgi:hypothetical protein